MDNRFVISHAMNNQVIELSSDNSIDIVVEANVVVTIIERPHCHDQLFKRAISVGQSARVTYMYEQHFNCAIEHSFTIGMSAQVNMFLFIKSAAQQQLNAQIYSDASFNCKGLYLAHDQQIVDIVSVQHHSAARAQSCVELKGILFDHSRASYKGTIHIDQKAMQSTAQQYNKNLMIGALSRATSIPSLEVLTDNVSCKHGTAMSSINPEDLFYFQSRGMQESCARNLFIEAFCNDVIHDAWAAQCKEFIMEKV